MLRNGVNYKGLYGNLRTCFGVENILVRFQWVFKGLLNIFLALYPAIYVPKRLVTSVAIVFIATSV